MTSVVLINFDSPTFVDSRGHTVHYQESHSIEDTVVKHGPTGGSFQSTYTFRNHLTVGGVGYEIGAVTTGELVVRCWYRRLDGSGTPTWEATLMNVYTSDSDAMYVDIRIGNSSTDGHYISFGDYNHNFNVAYDLPADQFVEIVVAISGSVAKVYADGVLLGSGACDPIPNPMVYVAADFGGLLNDERMDDFEILINEAYSPIPPPPVYANPYAHFYLGSKRGIVQLDCLEISHPSFSQVYYIVRNACNGLTVTHEDLTVHTYTYYPLKLQRTGAADDLDSTIQITLGDLGELVSNEIDRVRVANTFNIRPTVKFRQYRSDDLTRPIWGPYTFEAPSFQISREGTVFTAQAPQLNVVTTGLTYSMDRFPMLRGFL